MWLSENNLESNGKSRMNLLVVINKLKVIVKMTTERIVQSIRKAWFSWQLNKFWNNYRHCVFKTTFVLVKVTIVLLSILKDFVKYFSMKIKVMLIQTGKNCQFNCKLSNPFLAVILFNALWITCKKKRKDVERCEKMELDTRGKKYFS